MTTLDGVHGTVCNAQQYQQSLASPDSRDPSISCLTHGQTIGLTVSTCHCLSCFLNLSLKQLTAEASLISCVAVFAIYTWIAVSPTLDASIRSDDVFHSGMYDGIGKTSQETTGNCFRDLLTFSWSV